MVPYISNQYEKDAKAAGSKIKSYGKEVGLVTDKLVLEKVPCPLYILLQLIIRMLYDVPLNHQESLSLH
ncbi:TPA: ZmpA/ZmpB/ZmpC family metallo-endopeptidase [Streptococcus pneumoniae]